MRTDRNKIAHDYLFVNYVCSSGKHYPIQFRRFKKREQCEATGETFEDHGVLFRQLVDEVCERNIPGDFTFDSYFTSAANLNHIYAKKDHFDRPRAYIGDLKFNRKISYRGKEMKAEEFAGTIGSESRKELRRGDKRQWYFTCTIRIPGVNHKVRIVIIWNHRRDTGPGENTRHQPDRLGGDTHCSRLSMPPDRNRDLPSLAVSKSLAWETVSCAAARARQGICTW